ncbi:hypothetical protein K0040_13820 [Terrisporobacter petrolearius]|nr:hypothetical protein [Terrisporobacter petrolearius]
MFVLLDAKVLLLPHSKTSPKQQIYFVSAYKDFGSVCEFWYMSYWLLIQKLTI